MTSQRERLEAASANLANANSTRTASGQPYQRRDVVLTSQDLAEEWQANTSGSSPIDRSAAPPQGVKSEVVVSNRNQFVLQYQPGHPDADASGYVRLPDVDPLEETVNMMSAARSFEANATVFNVAKELARVSLNLGDA